MRPQVGPTPGITRPRLAPGGVITSALARGYQSADPHESVDPRSFDMRDGGEHHPACSAIGVSVAAPLMYQAHKQPKMMPRLGHPVHVSRAALPPHLGARASRRRERPGMGLTPGITESGLSPGGASTVMPHRCPNAPPARSTLASTLGTLGC